MKLSLYNIRAVLARGASKDRKVRRRAMAGVGVAVTALLLVGCSTSPGTPADGNKNSPINIGIVITETGALAGPYDGARGVATAWAASVNDAGGVNGHPIKLLIEDDQSTPATATSMVRKMVEQDKAAAVFFSSAVGSSVTADYLAEKKVAQIAADQGQRAPDSPTSWFTTDLGMPAVAQSAAGVAKSAGFDSVVAAVCSEVPACAGIGDLMSDYAPKIGVDYGGMVTIAGASTSATAQCLQIVESGSKSVAAFIGVNAALKIIDTCRTQGYEGGFVQLSWADSVISQLPGTQFGVLYSFPWWSDAAPVVAYREAVKKYAHESDYKASGSGTLWSQLSLFGYALEKAGPAAAEPVTGADVINAFRVAIKDVTLDGLLPQPITYSEEANTTITCFWPVRHEENGTYSTLEGSWKSGNGATGDLASQCTS